MAAPTQCTVTGSVINLLGDPVQYCTITVSVLTPFIHPSDGSWVSGELASTQTDENGDFSLAVIETETVGVKVRFTFDYYDGVSNRKQKTYTVTVPNSASAVLTDLITVETTPTPTTSFPASRVTVSAISGLSASDAQAAFAEHQSDIDGLTTSVASKLGTSLTSGQIYVGNGSNVATATAMSGDIGIDNAGVTSIQSEVIVNADVSPSAAIALSKLGATTASRALVTDGAGAITAATTTSTEIGYVNGVTSAIQTQLNAKAPAASPTFSGTVTTPVTASRALVTGASSELAASATTATQVGYLSNVSSDVQTQLDAKIAKTLTTTTGDMIYASSANTPARLGIGSSGQFLKVSGGIPSWGAGASGINYMQTNPDAESDASGYTVSKNTSAAATPDSGFVTASTNITWTRSTSTPLRGTGSFVLTKDAANRQGEQVYYSFTLDNADLAKPLCVSFDYTVGSGTYADGDVIVYLYDGTSFIQPTPYKILSTTADVPARWVGYFQTSATATSYRILFHVSSTSASAYTLKFDNFLVNPTFQPMGSVDQDWTSYTPTGSWSTNTTYTGKWRRVGDSLDLDILVSTAGAPTSASLTVNLPSGFTIDTTKVADTTAGVDPWLSTVVIRDGGTEIYEGAIKYSSTSAIAVFKDDGDGTQSAVTQAAPITFGAGDWVSIKVAGIPISGWSSSVLMSADAETRVVAFNGTKSGTQAVTASTTDITVTAQKDTHAGWSGSVYTCPVPGDYILSATFANNAAAGINVMAYKNGSLYAPIGSGPSGSYGGGSVLIPNCVAGTTLSVRADASITVFGTGQISIHKVAGPAQIAASEKVYALYNTNAGNTINSGTDNLTFSTKIVDSHNAWSGTVFTAPRAGFYNINGSIFLNANAASIHYVYINAVQKLGLHDDVSVNVKNFAAAYYLNAGDTLSIRSDTNETLSASTGLHWISIASQG